MAAAAEDEEHAQRGRLFLFGSLDDEPAGQSGDEDGKKGEVAFHGGGISREDAWSVTVRRAKTPADFRKFRDRAVPGGKSCEIPIELYRVPYTMTGNHSQRAYRHLRQKLLDGSVPPGSRLSYGSIGREIGVSATPVREAGGPARERGFRRTRAAARSGCQDPDARGGDRALRTARGARDLRDPACAERAGERLFAELERNLAESSALVAKVRRSGKKAAAKSSPRPSMPSISPSTWPARGRRESPHAQGRGRFAHSHAHLPGRPHSFRLDILETTQSEHEAIAAAVKDRDAAAAEEAMRRHIRNSLDLTLAEADNDPAKRWWVE